MRRTIQRIVLVSIGVLLLLAGGLFLALAVVPLGLAGLALGLFLVLFCLLRRPGARPARDAVSIHTPD